MKIKKKIIIFNCKSLLNLIICIVSWQAHLSGHMQRCMHYILGMHFPKCHGPSNRIHALVKQNAAHLYRLNKNNDQTQMFLVVFCIKRHQKNISIILGSIQCKELLLVCLLQMPIVCVCIHVNIYRSCELHTRIHITLQ